MDADDNVKPTTSHAAGVWKPQIHFVWEIIFSRLSTGRTGDAATFDEFFRVCVDESLFSSSSSPQRKYWGFQVFQLALSKAPLETVPHLFTKNFMRTWINHLREKDRYLHGMAEQVVGFGSMMNECPFPKQPCFQAENVQKYVRLQPSLGFTLILQLTGVNGNRAFDKLTRTKTVEGILSGMDASGVENYIQWLLEEFNDPITDKYKHNLTEAEPI